MIVETLLALILAVLLSIAITLYLIARAVFSLLNVDRIAKKYTRQIEKKAVSIERNAMPFLIKVAVVKVATFVAIRYIGKKLK